ncbi:MAG: heavy-metal-associated domain-containing protein [Alphaproteobacteria bacterium]|nr:heavy-metal-associated domain-containing protein [Alphaproteobacteria bacterium]
MNVQRFRVEGMHCDGCAMSLRKAIERRDAALNLTIDAKANLVEVTPSTPHPPAHLAQIIADAAHDVGYHFAGPYNAA